MLPIIGWREWVSLPDLGIDKIKAKVDTGARTSCLHAFKLEPFEKDGEAWLRIFVHPQQNNDTLEHTCEAKILEQRTVRDSGGHEELRYVVESRVQIGDYQANIELTLTNRDSMKFRMLLGRQAMRGHFMVDPSASYLLGTSS